MLGVHAVDVPDGVDGNANVVIQVTGGAANAVIFFSYLLIVIYALTLTLAPVGWIDAAGEEMMALDHALTELEALDQRTVRAVELRFFLGCTHDEAAELLQVSRATVERDLEFAKAWLFRRLSGREFSESTR